MILPILHFTLIGLDNAVRTFDMRKVENFDMPTLVLEGHTDTITGLRLNSDCSHILSTSMDNTVRSWDVRPFMLYGEGARQQKLFAGASNNYEKNLLRCAWSPDGNRVASGSSDWFVYVWEANNANIAYKLPGHRGGVNEVDFHPTQPIIASMSSDKQIFLGEIEAS